jgi:hypothetical protein
VIMHKQKEKYNTSSYNNAVNNSNIGIKQCQ